MAADMLFATLDPTMRQIQLPGKGKVILSDTVGFVSDLPTELVAAFRATLEEVTTADLIAHVRDMSHPDCEAQYADVQAILTDLGVTMEQAEGEPPVPQIEIWNKIDQCSEEQRELLTARAALRDDVVMVSALTGEGIDEARAQLAAALSVHHILGRADIPAQNGDALAWLFGHGQIVEQREKGEGTQVLAKLAPSDWNRFAALWPDIGFSAI